MFSTNHIGISHLFEEPQNPALKFLLVDVRKLFALQHIRVEQLEKDPGV